MNEVCMCWSVGKCVLIRFGVSAAQFTRFGSFGRGMATSRVCLIYFCEHGFVCLFVCWQKPNQERKGTKKKRKKQWKETNDKYSV